MNDRHRLTVREDGKGDVVVAELEEKEAGTAEELLAFIDQVCMRRVLVYVGKSPSGMHVTD